MKCLTIILATVVGLSHPCFGSWIYTVSGVDPASGEFGFQKTSQQAIDYEQDFNVAYDSSEVDTCHITGDVCIVAEFFPVWPGSPGGQSSHISLEGPHTYLGMDFPLGSFEVPGTYPEVPGNPFGDNTVPGVVLTVSETTSVPEPALGWIFAPIVFLGAAAKGRAIDSLPAFAGVTSRQPAWRPGGPHVRESGAV